jgi:hypothetical protein
MLQRHRAPVGGGDLAADFPPVGARLRVFHEKEQIWLAAIVTGIRRASAKNKATVVHRLKYEVSGAEKDTDLKEHQFVVVRVSFLNSYSQ